jgi:hypothetical protein
MPMPLLMVLNRTAKFEQVSNVGYDPDPLLEHYESGVGVEILLRRHEGPASGIPPEHGMT